MGVGKSRRDILTGPRGEVGNHHQVLRCVTERVNECLDNAAETPLPSHSLQTPPPSLPPAPGWPVGQPRPISRPRGIKPLRTVIAFADPIADPIGSWENDINWWSDPIMAEFWRAGNFFVLWWGGSWFTLKTRGGELAYLWASVPQAPCLLVRMLTIFCFNWLAVTWSLCLVALMRWSHIFSSSFLSAAYWAQLD